MLYYSHGVVFLLLIFNLQSYADNKGHLVIIGGGERAAVILNKISELAGGPDGKIVIIPVANSNPLEIALLQRYEFEETGIDESTAIWVKPDYTFEVIGWNSVMILDAAKANGIAIDIRHNFSVNNMLLHLLTSGQSYDLSARQVIE